MSVVSTVGLADKTKLSWPKLSDQRWLSPLILLAAWEAASLLGWIPSRILAAPSAVLQTFWRLTVDWELPNALAVSLARMGVGLAIGVTTGAALALVSGLSKLGETLVDPPLQIIRPLPTLALTPLFIVWLGIGETPKIALIALGVTFPVYLNLFNAIRSVDPRLMEAGGIRPIPIGTRDGLYPHLRRDARAEGSEPGHPARRVRRAPGRQRLRQDHPFAHPGGP